MNRSLNLLDRFKMTENTFMLLSAAFIGVLAGCGSVLFRKLVAAFQYVFGKIYDLLQVSQVSDGDSTIGTYIVLFVLFASVLWFSRWFARKITPDSMSHGVVEVIEAVSVKEGQIQGRSGWLTTLLSPLMIAVGGSCGSEGPIALIGASFGSKFGQWVQVNEDRLKVFVACGAAGGIAASFDAPFGGFMFAIEIILMDFGLTKVAPIVVSTVVAEATAHRFHKERLFDIHIETFNHDNWLIAVVILGLVVGMASGLYVRVMDGVSRFFQHEKVTRYGDLIVWVATALFVGCIVLRPEVLGLGYGTLNEFFKGGYASWHILLALFLLKIMATAITIGSGGSGGIFTPALFIGGMSGIFTAAALNSFSPDFFSGIEPATYGIIGMGAMVSGAMRAPITGFMITYELNRVGNHSLILPLMLACVISTVMSRRFVRHGIFTISLARKGSLVVKGRDVELTRRIKVKDCYDEKYFMVPLSMSFRALFKLAQTADHHSLFFVCDGIKLLGVIPMHRIRSYFNQIQEVGSVMVAEDLMMDADPVLGLDDNLEFALALFDRSQQKELPVVVDGNIKGVLTHSRAVTTYNQALHHMNLMHDLGDSIPGTESNEGIDLGDGMRIREIEVPQSFCGKTVQELNLTGKYEVQILMIKGKDQLHITVVRGDRTLKKEQILVLMGPSAAVDKIARL